MYVRETNPVYLNVSDKEFDKHLKWCMENRIICIEAKYEDIKNTFTNKYEFNRKYPSSLVYYFKSGRTKLYLTYKKGSQWFNFYYNANNPKGGELVREQSGGDVYRRLQQYAHIPDLRQYSIYGFTPLPNNKVGWVVSNIMPAPYVNCRLGNKTKVYAYDKHRAFLEACIGLYPDTSVTPKSFERIGKNEVGFDEDGIPILEDDGHSHLFVFPLIEMPGIEKWAKQIDKEILDRKEYCLKNKLNPSEDQQLFNSKHEYTDAIGMICRHNPFVHNMIVRRCMDIMDSLIDENTVYSVTDSIFSIVERKDLIIGERCGEFSFDGEGLFYKTSAGYKFEKDNKVKVKERGPNMSDMYYLGHRIYELDYFLLHYDNVFTGSTVNNVQLYATKENHNLMTTEINGMRYFKTSKIRERTDINEERK